MKRGEQTLADHHMRAGETTERNDQLYALFPDMSSVILDSDEIVG